MGQCYSNKTFPAHSVSTALQKDHDRKIEENLRAEQDEEKKVIKCLLLGAGECGQSTRATHTASSGEAQEADGRAD